MTQPMYDVETIGRVYEATRHIGIPVFIGIMPLTGFRNALFLHNEVPGIKIAPVVMERMRRCPGKEEGRREGVAIARELVDAAMDYFKGIYLITPFFQWRMTAELVRHIRERDKRHAVVGE
jgi:homocysteine S-methyltransferase